MKGFVFTGLVFTVLIVLFIALTSYVNSSDLKEKAITGDLQADLMVKASNDFASIINSVGISKLDSIVDDFNSYLNPRGIILKIDSVLSSKLIFSVETTNGLLKKSTTVNY